jgi:hypothetical protein
VDRFKKQGMMRFGSMEVVEVMAEGGGLRRNFRFFSRKGRW